MKNWRTIESEGTLITVLHCLCTVIKGIRFFIICGMQILYQSEFATDHDKWPSINLKSDACLLIKFCMNFYDKKSC